MKYLLLLITILSFLSCKKDDTTPIIPLPTNEYYYPPLTGDTWETKTSTSSGWDDAKLTEAFDYAGTKSTYGLIVLTIVLSKPFCFLSFINCQNIIPPNFLSKAYLDLSFIDL